MKKYQVTTTIPFNIIVEAKNVSRARIATKKHLAENFDVHLSNEDLTVTEL